MQACQTDHQDNEIRELQEKSLPFHNESKLKYRNWYGHVESLWPSNPHSEKIPQPLNFSPPPDLQNGLNFFPIKATPTQAGACQSACASQPIRNVIARGFPDPSSACALQKDIGINDAISTGSNQLKCNSKAKVTMTLANSKTTFLRDTATERDEIRSAAVAPASRAQPAEFNAFDPLLNETQI